MLFHPQYLLPNSLVEIGKGLKVVSSGQHTEALVLSHGSQSIGILEREHSTPGVFDQNDLAGTEKVLGDENTA